MIIHVSVSPGEIRAVACDAAGPLDVAIERAGAPDGVGDLHRGRVTGHVPALAGCFVRLLDGSEGFLPDSAGGRQVEGTPLGVRVVRAAQGGKGPRLTARLDDAEQALVGPGPVALLRRGPGAVARLAALHPAAPVEIDDAGALAGLRGSLGGRLRLVARGFDDALEAALEGLGEPDAVLTGGVRISVHATPALTAIDMDLAAATAPRGGKGRNQEQANRAALPGLARQIRLRNLAGAIVVDLAGLSVKARAALGPALEQELARDPLAPRFLGFTGLGLAEILRPRVHPPLHELLGTPHAVGLAALRAAMRQAAAVPHAALALHASGAVVAALQGDAAALAAYAQATGRAIVLRAEPPAPSGWRIAEVAHG